MRASITSTVRTFALTFSLSLSLAAACGGSQGPSTPAPSPTGTTPSALNGCSTYEDHTPDGDARTIPWGFAVTSAPAHCMMIKAGQTVRWNGDLTVHPLGAKGGDSPNPLENADTSGRVSFLSAGTFGYRCTVHDPMIGAIHVVP